MPDKKKFLFVSLRALIGDIAWQVLKEGHDVKYYIEAPKEESDIARRLRAQVRRLAAGRGLGRRHRLRRHAGPGRQGRGRCGSRASSSSAGPPTRTTWRTTARSARRSSRRPASASSPTGEFDNFDDAIAHVRSQPGRATCIKPSGEAQNVKRRLFVGEEDDGADVIQMLEAYKRAFSEEIKVFQLQKRVSGVEMAVGAFFNGRRVRDAHQHQLRAQEAVPGEHRAPTGEMGTSMYWSAPNRIFNADPQEDGGRAWPPRATSATSTVNCIVNGNGIYPLEFTSRFGYPTIMHPAGGHDHAHRAVLPPTWRRARTRSCG